MPSLSLTCIWPNPSKGVKAGSDPVCRLVQPCRVTVQSQEQEPSVAHHNQIPNNLASSSGLSHTASQQGPHGWLPMPRQVKVLVQALSATMS